MAHSSEIVGKYSQVVAKAALMANGFEVAETETDEPYDFVTKDPANQRWVTMQCKTIRLRKDRNNEKVVYATNGNGDSYRKEDVDYIVGVLAQDGENPKVYYFENRGCKEYWESNEKTSTRWDELPLEIDRDFISESKDETY